MNSLVANITAIMDWLKIPSVAITSLVFLVAGYLYMAGGDKGRQQSKVWIVGGCIGLALVLGAFTFGSELGTKINFGG